MPLNSVKSKNHAGIELKYFIKKYLMMFPAHKIEIKKEEMMESCGISRSHLYRWMRATQEDNLNIKTDHLIKIATILDCSVGDLINENNDI